MNNGTTFTSWELFPPVGSYSEHLKDFWTSLPEDPFFKIKSILWWVCVSFYISLWGRHHKVWNAVESVSGFYPPALFLDAYRQDRNNSLLFRRKPGCRAHLFDSHIKNLQEQKSNNPTEARIAKEVDFLN